MPSQLKWLRHREVGQQQQAFVEDSDTISRLNLERTLDGHKACVNCLDWNQAGTVLASGSDDQNVVIWDPFKAIKKKVIETSHNGSIFSVKFQPHSSENLVATCSSDGQVKVTNVLLNETILNCKSCHTDRVKKLATHPQEPHLLWSAAEDGKIMQYDLREQHVCERVESGFRSGTNNTIVDLKALGQTNYKAKSISVNPVKSEMLAVGCNDPHVRLYDRRRLASNSVSGNNNNNDNDQCQSFTSCLTPGHLADLYNYSKSSFGQLYSTTYLAFSHDGGELLANMNMEQIYLYDLNNPKSCYKSFELSVAPLLVNMGKKNLSKTKCHSVSSFRKLNIQLDTFQDSFDTGKNLSKDELERLDQLIEKDAGSVDLYNLRASALIRRNWPSDVYQALRDTCSALKINPNNIRSLVNLIICSNSMGDQSVTLKVLDMMEQRLGPKARASARDALMQHNIIQTFIADYPAEDYQDREFSLVGPRDESLMIIGDNDDADIDNSEDATETETHFTDYIDTIYSYPISESIGDNHDDNGSVARNQDCFDMTNDCAVHGNNNPQPSSNNEKKPMNSIDYSKRFCGHCNLYTDIKEANFFGSQSQFIVAGSDDGACFIWDKKTTNLVKAVHGDMQVLNCVQPHPNLCLLATSGIEPLVKLWSPIGHINHDVKALERRCLQNAKYITSDPWDTLIRELASRSGNFYY